MDIKIKDKIKHFLVEIRAESGNSSNDYTILGMNYSECSLF